ncbi:MAG: T9SS type A sorting domain-containing protein [Flavobacteriales bacterium]|nr:T9SS type A sorting domain-containing protein [Flavobacteriales bacterium]
MKTFYSKTKALILSLSLAWSFGAVAQSGGGVPNDLCANATPMTCTGTYIGSIDGSTTTGAPSCHSSYNGVWYSFVGDGNVAILSTDDPTTDFDTYLAVVESCGGACVASDDDGGSGLTSELSLSTVNGQTYYVNVTGWSGSSTGAFALSLTCVTPPANDLCENAIEVFCDDDIAGTTEGSTNTGAPSGIGNGVWYVYTGDDQTVTVETCTSTSGFDTEIAVFTGDCNNRITIGSNDDGCSPYSSLSFEAWAGLDYYIYVGYYSSSSSATGDFDLTVSCAALPVPDNDLCGNAIALECGDAIIGNTAGATATDGPDCNSTAPGVWFSFVGDGTDYTISLDGSGYDTYLGITESCGGACVASNDDINYPSNVTSEISGFTTTNGQTYYIYVSGWEFTGESGTYLLSLTSSACEPPANNLCADAEEIFCGDVVTGDNSFATEEISSSGPGVWYTFQGNGQDVTFSTCSTVNDPANLYDTEITLLKGDCGALTQLDQDDDGCGTTFGPSTLSWYAHPDTVYYIYVGAWISGNTDAGEFVLTVSCACPNIAAGTSTASAATVCMSGGSATVAAVPDANQVVPAGYVVTGVLADASGNVLDAGALSYTVNAAGDYYVHVAVVNSADLPIYLTASTVAGLHALTTSGGGSLCGSIDQTGTLVTVNPEPTAAVSGGGAVCSGNSAIVTVDFTGTAPWTVQWAWDGTPGTTETGITDNPYTFGVPANTYGELTIVSVSDGNVCSGTSSGSATITDASPTATISGDFISCNGSTVEAQIDFTGVGPWDVTLMTPDGQSVPLTGITDNPYMLPLNNPQSGSYTLTAVSDANCSGGSVSGAATVALENPDAGALEADENPACWSAPFITISATADGNAVEPSGYQTTYLLVDGNGDVVSSAGSPSFAVTSMGDYVIHTLVYDPNTLTPGDYSTAADLLAVLTQGGGSICAALDETGAAISVVDCTPPANDVCSSATTVACGDVVAGDFLFASADNTASDCGNTVGPGVWYVFAGTGDMVTVSTCGSNADTEVSVYEGDCNSLVCVDFNDDECGIQSSVTFLSVQGTDYYINVAYWSGSTLPTVGDFDLTVACASPPTNNEACGSEALSLGANGPYTHSSFYDAAAWETSFTVPTVGCTEQGGWCIDVDIENSAWYSFVAPASGNVSISSDGSSFDTQLAVFSGSCQDVEGGNGVLLGANDDDPDASGSGGSTLTSNVLLCGLTGGETYYVLVDGWGGATGDLTLTITEIGPSADFTSSATNLAVDFTDASTASGTIVSWAWDFDDASATSTDQNPSYTFTAAGTYNVCLTVTDDAGCSSTYCEDVMVTDIPTSIAEAVEHGLEVYPNPSNGQFVVTIRGVEAPVQLTVIDVAGRAVYTEGAVLSGNYRKELNLNVASGSYLLQVITDEGLVTRKILVQ